MICEYCNTKRFLCKWKSCKAESFYYFMIGLFSSRIIVNVFYRDIINSDGMYVKYVCLHVVMGTLSFKPLSMKYPNSRTSLEL